MPGVDGRAHAGVEQVGFEKDLAVGDGDDVGRNEGRHVARLGFDDGQAGERAGLALDAAVGDFLHVLLVDARRALEQTRMQIEHVARVGFAARRAAQQQRDLAIGDGLLGQIVVHDQRVLAVVHEVLAHGAAAVGREILHRGRHRGGRRDDDGVRHRAVLFELAHHVGDRALLLSDGDVDALNAGALLIDDGIDGHRGLAGLAVADDELALAAADRHHGIDGLETGLHRLRHALAENHARRHALERRLQLGVHRALAVDRLAQRVDHAAEKFRAHRHFENAPGGLDLRSLGDVLVVARAPPRRPSPARGSAPDRRCCRRTPAFRRSARRRGRGCARCRR